MIFCKSMKTWTLSTDYSSTQEWSQKNDNDCTIYGIYMCYFIFFSH